MGVIAAYAANWRRIKTFLATHKQAHAAKKLVKMRIEIVAARAAVQQGLN